MRDLINLFEAKKSAQSVRPVVPSDTVVKAILTTAHKLAGAPLFLRPNREWADQVMTMLKSKKAVYDSDADMGDFDPKEELSFCVDKVWARGRDGFVGVRHDVEHEETNPMGYSARARERHGVEPDDHSGNHDVESSQWLTAMHKQGDVGNHISCMASMTDASAVLTMLRELDVMLDYFDVLIDDGGEEPTLVEDMVVNLPKLIPLLLLAYKASPTV